jgi:hypothetical protein
MFAALLFGRLVNIYSGMPAHIFVLFWLGLLRQDSSHTYMHD